MNEPITITATLRDWTSNDYSTRATKAEQEAAEWKQRFDVLLRRDEKKGNE